MDGLKKAVVIISIIFTGSLFAKEQFTECFNCSISQRQAVAISEASPTIDKDNNTVPDTSAGLKDLIVNINQVGQARLINQFINQFNYFVPTTTGRVIITDCDPDGCPANNTP